MRREPGAASASAASASAASAGAASASAVSASAASTWLRSQARLARGATMALVGFGLANAAVGVMQALSLSHLVGPALLGRRIVDVPLWAGVFAFSALLRSALGLASDARAVAAGAAARRRLRTGFLVAAFARGPHRTPATALTTAVDQIEALDSYFSRWLATATLAWAAPLLVLLAVLPADPVAALAMAAGGACVPLGMALAGLGAAKASQQQFAAMARLQTRFLDRVRGIATIVLAGQAEAEALRLHDAARELARRTMRVLRVAFLSSAVLDTAAVAVLVFLAVRAGLAWRGSGLHPIAAVFGLVLVSEFFAPLRAFAAAYQDRIQANAAATTLGASPEHTAPSAAPPIRTVAASSVTVVFENVDFSWDAARGPALSKLSFRVPPNETTILVGASGSGKSTVIEMMLGFIRPDAGRITINGADLDSLTPAALSRITAWIGQRPALFAGSIRENIRFGQQDTTDGATDRAIEEAALAAGLDAGAAWLPQGLDTLVGEGGYGLSGGQAQRVAIARAFVRNAPLLLLDEPTAHLDPATEADVLDSLKRLAIGRTVIMAAHSSAAMAFGGRRIALDHGHVADVQGVA